MAQIFTCTIYRCTYTYIHIYIVYNIHTYIYILYVSYTSYVFIYIYHISYIIFIYQQYIRIYIYIYQASLASDHMLYISTCESCPNTNFGPRQRTDIYRRTLKSLIIPFHLDPIHSSSLLQVTWSFRPIPPPHAYDHQGCYNDTCNNSSSIGHPRSCFAARLQRLCILHDCILHIAFGRLDCLPMANPK